MKITHNAVFVTITGSAIRILQVNGTPCWVVQHVESGKIILNGLIPFTTESLTDLLSQTTDLGKVQLRQPHNLLSV